MTAKAVVPRGRALADLRAAARYYRSEAGKRVALEFADAWQATLRLIGEYPAAGSSHYDLALGKSGLRSRTVGRFPYLAFYVEHRDRVEVLRVLHARRDIPRLMQEPF